MQQKLSAENLIKVVAAGGIEAIVKVISIHINNPDVCTAGCGALNSMLLNNCKNDLMPQEIVMHK